MKRLYAFIAAFLAFSMPAQAFLSGGGGGGGGGGSVNSVSATAPIQNTGTASDPVIACIVATNSVPGCLSAADHVTFAGKQAALTFSAPLSNTSNTVSCAVASNSVAGCMSTADHTLLGTALQAANNLSDVTATTARTNLGLGTSSTHPAGDFCAVANNLSDVTAATALSNLGGLPKAGGTMTGSLTLPNGSVSTPAINVGDSGTGLYRQALNTIGATINGALVALFNATGIQIGGPANSAAVSIKAGNGDNTFLIENNNNARVLSITGETATNFSIGIKGTNPAISIGSGANASGPSNWLDFGADGARNPGVWPVEFTTPSGDGNITSPASFVKSNGAGVNGYPLVVIGNQNSTSDVIECLGLTGSSNALQGYVCAQNHVQTASSEKGYLRLGTNNSGTPTDGWLMDDQQNTKTIGHEQPALGTTPVVNSGDCGTGSNGSVSGTDQAGLITIGATATTTCKVTFGSSTWWSTPSSCILGAGNATGATAMASVYVSALSSSSFTITATALASSHLYYHCY